MMREAEHGNNVDFDDLADSALCRSFEQFRFTQAGVVNQHVNVEIARVQLPHQDVNRFRIG